jgi:hypothetical protein
LGIVKNRKLTKGGGKDAIGGRTGAGGRTSPGTPFVEEPQVLGGRRYATKTRWV